MSSDTLDKLITFKSLNPQIHGRLNTFTRGILGRMHYESTAVILDSLRDILDNAHVKVSYEKEELRSKLLLMDGVSSVIMRKKHISLTLETIIMKPADESQEEHAIAILEDAGREPNTSIAIPGLVLHIKWSEDLQSGAPSFRCGLTPKKDVGVYYQGFDGSELMHPHWISANDPCLGDFGPPITEARAAMDIPLQVILLLMYLRQYNTDDCAGRKFYRWAPEKELVKLHCESISDGTHGALRNCIYSRACIPNTPHFEFGCDPAFHYSDWISGLYNAADFQSAHDSLAYHLPPEVLETQPEYNEGHPDFEDILWLTRQISQIYVHQNNRTIVPHALALMFLENQAGLILDPEAPSIERKICHTIAEAAAPWARNYLVRHHLASLRSVEEEKQKCLNTRARYSLNNLPTPIAHQEALTYDRRYYTHNERMIFVDGKWSNDGVTVELEPFTSSKLQNYLLERWNFYADHIEALERNFTTPVEAININQEQIKEAYFLAIEDLKASPGLQRQYREFYKDMHGSAPTGFLEGWQAFANWLVVTYRLVCDGKYIKHDNMSAYNLLPLQRQKAFQDVALNITEDPEQASLNAFLDALVPELGENVSERTINFLEALTGENE